MIFFSISRSGVLEMIKECIDDEKTPKEIIIEVKDSCAKNNISEQDALVMVIHSLFDFLMQNHRQQSFKSSFMLLAIDGAVVYL